MDKTIELSNNYVNLSYYITLILIKYDIQFNKEAIKIQNHMNNDFS